MYIQINGVEESNPYACTHKNIFQYRKLTPPIRKQEPGHVHHFTTKDKVDVGTIRECGSTPYVGLTGHRSYNSTNYKLS